MCTHETGVQEAARKEREREIIERTHVLVLLTLMTCSCLDHCVSCFLIIHENKESVLPELVMVCLCLEKQ